jgi:hypothetical protein
MAHISVNMYIIVANHDRQECGVEAVANERAMQAIETYQKAGRNISGCVKELPSREAAETYAKGKYKDYHFLGD